MDNDYIAYNFTSTVSQTTNIISVASFAMLFYISDASEILTMGSHIRRSCYACKIYLTYLVSLFLYLYLRHDTYYNCPEILVTTSSFEATLSGSVRCASDWRQGGHRFDPCQGRQHSFVEIDHEIFSTVIPFH